MGMISEFPALVKNVFITQEINDAGIYALRFFIRGKPWVVTVDDYFLFDYSDSSKTKPFYSNIGTNNQIWGMVAEKAFAKVKGSYAATNGGFVKEAITILTGAPVFSYNCSEISDDDAFNTIKAANDANYIIGAGTNGGSDTT